MKLLLGAEGFPVGHITQVNDLEENLKQNSLSHNQIEPYEQVFRSKQALLHGNSDSQAKPKLKKLSKALSDAHKVNELVMSANIRVKDHSITKTDFELFNTSMNRYQSGLKHAKKELYKHKFKLKAPEKEILNLYRTNIHKLIKIKKTFKKTLLEKSVRPIKTNFQPTNQVAETHQNQQIKKAVEKLLDKSEKPINASPQPIEQAVETDQDDTLSVSSFSLLNENKWDENNEEFSEDLDIDINKEDATYQNSGNTEVWINISGPSDELTTEI